MNKKFVILPIIIIIIAIITLGSQSNQPENTRESSFHVTLADPKKYEEGVYSSEFVFEKGDYIFRFVPNGDSPQDLTILLEGDDILFSENFKLNGTLHETGISEYYTWDYDGEKSMTVLEPQEVSIQINPNGNLKGSVSVYIDRN
ncbi:MAG: hypothetical protein OEQ12_01855 [Nitrosopumilus sp.]|nr:hypothetical protein [Nitrosopumilus sp.]